jgi:hypothetical protein
MSEQENTQQNASGAAAHERCLCREMLEHAREVFGVSPNVQQHFANSRIEFLKGLRAIIDNRIEHLSSSAQRGTKIAVE